MRTVEVYETKPQNFNPQTEVAACYLECDGKLLLLLNAFDDSEAGLWGVPAGKLESNETPVQGAARELFEETSILIDSSQIQRFLSFTVIRCRIYRYTLQDFSGKIH